MLRSAQPSQFSTHPNQYIDTPGLAVLLCIIDLDTGERPLSLNPCLELTLKLVGIGHPRP